MKKRTLFPILALMLCLCSLLWGQAHAVADGDVLTDEQGREYTYVVFDIYHQGDHNINNFS